MINRTTNDFLATSGLPKMSSKLLNNILVPASASRCDRKIVAMKNEDSLEVSHELSNVIHHPSVH